MFISAPYFSLQSIRKRSVSSAQEKRGSCISCSSAPFGLPCFSVDKHTVPEGKAQEPKGYFEVPFLFGEGKESGGQKDTWIVALGSAALEVEQRARQDNRESEQR